MAILGIVVFNVLQRGLPAINLDLFTEVQPPFGEAGGGIGHAIVGTMILVGLATLMALPFGVLVAIYVQEFSRTSVGRVIRLSLDVLNGVPSIVIGIFVFALIVQPLHQQSAWAGAFALAIIMLPLVARATIEVLALVPESQREASFALGVSRWRTVLRVVLPSVLGGVVTGTVLAVARAAGETAPLLFTTSLYANHIFDGRDATDREPAHDDLHLLGGARSAPQRPGVGSRRDSDRLRACTQRRSAHCTCAQSAEARRQLTFPTRRSQLFHQLFTG